MNICRTTTRMNCVWAACAYVSYVFRSQALMSGNFHSLGYLDDVLLLFTLLREEAVCQQNVLAGWLVYPFSSLGWRYGANSNPGSRYQPN